MRVIVKYMYDCKSTMIRLALCCLLLATSTLGGIFPLDVARPNDSRIIGGSEADIGEYPSEVSLRLLSYDDMHYGAGFIISEKWVLTAGHCGYGIEASDVEIVAGTNDLTSGGTRHRALRFVIHELFNFVELVHDIAVLEVIEPFIMSTLIQPASLPMQDQFIETGASAIAIGWGHTSEAGNVSNTLLEVNVEIRDQDWCTEVYDVLGLHVFPTEICADDPEGGHSTCQGDSGGPLLVEGTAVGIVSWGWGCARPGLPTVYTRIASYRDWITQQSGV